MSFSSFLTIAQETNYDIVELFKQSPNESFTILAVLLAIILIAYYFIRKEVKISSALKLVDKIQDCKTYDEFNEKLLLMVQELPKRGVKVADVLNTCKEHILFRSCKLIENMNIEDKINKYEQMAKNYKDLASASKKYNKKDLTEFFENKADELLNEDLFSEIKFYYENTHFTQDDISSINRIVKHANSRNRVEIILSPMLETINKFSFGYNLDLFKFIEKLDEENSKQVYKACNEKIENLFTSGEDEISINILDYLFEKEEFEKVYSYISNLKLKSYLQQLHDLYFDKKDKLDLDLAFIANPLKINNEYKKYIDESLTNNWRDSKHVDYVSKAPGVLEVLGHVEFRTLIERLENIAIQEENRKMVEEALAIAKRAEIIALEAKSLSKKPIVLPSLEK